MGRYLGPKVRLSRRVGVPIADVPKHTGKELQIPGMHGYRGRRMTEYGVRMAEKQKLRFHYSIMEKQFRRFKGIAQKTKGNTGEALISLLERRLDNVVRRLAVARTIWAARQMVVHGHVLVNGKTLPPREAQRLGVQGVPFIVLENRLAISGAQPAELFDRALGAAAEDG